MAHNPLIRGGVGSGSWTGVVVTTTDMETFDQRQFESINGDLGGTWAPAAAIVIGGAGLSVTGTSFNVSATSATFSNGLFIAAGNFVCEATTTTFVGATAFQSGATFVGGSNLILETGSSFTVAAGGSFIITAASSFLGTLALSGIVTVSAAATFSANASFSGSSFIVTSPTILFGTGSSTISIIGPVVLSQSGHICKRVVSAGLDADVHIGATTASANFGDVFKPGSIASNRIWVVDDATEGAEIDVSLIDTSGSFAVTLRRSDATAIIILKNDTLIPYGAVLVWHSGQWQVKYAIRH